MHRFHFAIWLGSFLLAGSLTAEQKDEPMKFGMVIHGGAGTIERSEMTPENEAAHRAGLEQALKAGYDVLERGGSSLDAVEAAIQVLEDNPLFNAGKGAVFTHEGTNELDSSIMDGKTLNAGAVASVKHIRNPISLARLVMEKSPHVMLDGEGAEAFAKKMGMKLVDSKYFYTDERWQALQKVRPTPSPVSRQGSPRYGRRGCSRQGGESRRRHLDRRDHEQAVRPDRRLAYHRRRDLCE